MNLFKLSAALLLAVSGLRAVAQNPYDSSGSSPSFSQPSAIVAGLKPVVVKGSDQPDPSAWQLGLDLATTKELLPGTIRTETIWKTTGKNSISGINQPAIDLEKLVPVLVGALQEQILRVTGLEKEVEFLKLQAKNHEMP